MSYLLYIKTFQSIKAFQQVEHLMADVQLSRHASVCLVYAKFFFACTCNLCLYVLLLLLQLYSIKTGTTHTHSISLSHSFFMLFKHTHAHAYTQRQNLRQTPKVETGCFATEGVVWHKKMAATASKKIRLQIEKKERKKERQKACANEQRCRACET